MLTCEQTEHLFDAFLDGQLSSSLRAEVHTHRLRCHHCNHSLALLESCADVVACDRREPELNEDFTDRVLGRLAADPIPVSSRRSTRSMPRVYRLFAPVAAAAAAVAVTVMIAPPVRQKAVPSVPVAVNDHPAKESKVSAAVTAMMIDEQGNVNVMTVAPDETDSGQFRRTGMYKEVPDSLAETMIESGLKPTFQGLNRVQQNNRALRQLGRILLLDTLGELASDTGTVDSLSVDSMSGDSATDESSSPAEVQVIPVAPSVDEVQIDSDGKGNFPT